MSAYPRFWAGPLRYLKWSSRERPAYFWSVVIGAVGPISIPITLKIREWVGDENAPRIPVTYPGRLRSQTICLATREEMLTNIFFAVPTGPRKQLTGYDDE